MSLRPEPTPAAEALAAVRAPFEAFGGQWIDAPVLQPLGLLLDLAGEAMRARLVIVQSEGGEPAVLRPDFTIPVVRAHIDGGATGGRYLYQGKVFRAVQGGAGAPEELLQIGAEVFGPADDRPAEDASVAALAWAAASAGGRDDLSLLLGDVGLFSAFLTAIGLPETVVARLARAFASGRSVAAELSRAQKGGGSTPAGAGRLAALLSGLPEAEAGAVLEELWRLAGIQPVGGRSAAEIVHRLIERSEGDRGPRVSLAEADLILRYLQISGSPRAALEAVETLAYTAKVEFDVQLELWVRRLKALAAAGAPEDRLTLSTGFARPFGYYDGVLFEVRSAGLGPDRPVAAGGRYDGLPARLGAQGAGGAIGCIVRPARAIAGGTA